MPSMRRQNGLVVSTDPMPMSVVTTGILKAVANSAARSRHRHSPHRRRHKSAGARTRRASRRSARLVRIDRPVGQLFHAAPITRDRQHAAAVEQALPVLHVLRHVDHDGTGSAGPGDLEGGPTVASSFVGSVTRKMCLATAPMIEGTGASWNASVPIAAVATWPQITTIGTESAIESRTGVTVFVAPGPEVTMHTPTRPVARA
jgi:hypothetical protein